MGRKRSNFDNIAANWEYGISSIQPSITRRHIARGCAGQSQENVAAIKVCHLYITAV